MGKSNAISESKIFHKVIYWWHEHDWRPNSALIEREDEKYDKFDKFSEQFRPVPSTCSWNRQISRCEGR